MQRALVFVFVTALIAAFTSGCTTTQPSAQVGGEQEYAKNIDMTVGVDQSMVMGGKKVQITEVSKHLTKVKASKHLIIVVAPESKLAKETLVTLLNLLGKDGYYFTAGQGSKYADVIQQIQGKSKLSVE